MPTKTLPASYKAAEAAEGDDAQGVFEALVAVFGNIDYGGDRILPGAFGDTLSAWKERGDPIPVIWSHESWDPFAHIGQVLDAEERKEGLWVKGQLDLDAPKAAQVWRLLKGRRVTQFSFAYDVDEGGYVTDEDDSTVFELKKLTLHEVGPTLLGMNPATQLLGTKDLASLMGEVHAGHTLDAHAEAILRGAHKALGEVVLLLDHNEASPGPGSAATAADCPSLRSVTSLVIEAELAS